MITNSRPLTGRWFLDRKRDEKRDIVARLTAAAVMTVVGVRVRFVRFARFGRRVGRLLEEDMKF